MTDVFRHELNIAMGLPRKRPKTLRCLWCRGRIRVGSHGRLPRFCSQTCRQRAYERRKWQRPHLMQHLHDELFDIRVEAAVHRVLQRQGLASEPAPSAPPRRKRPTLRVVKSDEDRRG